jgi:hypothetical protein
MDLNDSGGNLQPQPLPLEKEINSGLAMLQKYGEKSG